MKKLLYFLFNFILMIALVCTFSSCSSCEHVYDNACDADCNKCGDKREVAHDYMDATCTTPKTCKICGATDGEADDEAHNYGGEYGISGGAHWLYCQNEGCEERLILAHESEAPATYESPEYCAACGYLMAPKLSPLTNKKILIIGNSHFFYSDVVIEKTADNTKLSNRENDKGTLYDIAYSNGATGLQITNWTYGNHTFKDLFSGDCQANRACGNGYDHLKDLTDKYYDYVILQHGPDSADVREEWMEFAMNIFKEANPNVKFVLVVPARSHDGTVEPPRLLPKIKEYEQKYNMIVVDWGGLVYDIYTGKVSVPGAKYIHNKETYVVARDESDGYHPSLLAGYVTSLMTYCAITGESAVGQSWDYYTNTRIKTFIDQKYKLRPTNFDLILNSADDMRGIQQLIDQYLEEKPYLQY